MKKTIQDWLMILFGILTITWMLKMMHACVTTSEQQNKIDIKLRNACLYPGDLDPSHSGIVVGEANRYSDGISTVLCTDGKNQWVRSVDVKEYLSE